MSTKDLNLRSVDDKIRYLANSNLANHMATGLLEHLNILPCEGLNYSSYTIFIKQNYFNEYNFHLIGEGNQTQVSKALQI